MPFYHIIIMLRNGDAHKGVRENQNTFIDRVWEEYYGLACKSYGAELANFVCVQISKNSQEYKDYKARLKKAELPIDREYRDPAAIKHANYQRPGKYRSDTTATEGQGWGERKMKEIEERRKNS